MAEDKSLYPDPSLGEQEDGKYLMPFKLSGKPTVVVYTESRNIERVYDEAGQLKELIPGPTTTWFAFKAVTHPGRLDYPKPTPGEEFKWEEGIYPLVSGSR